MKTIQLSALALIATLFTAALMASQPTPLAKHIAWRAQQQPKVAQQPAQKQAQAQQPVEEQQAGAAQKPTPLAQHIAWRAAQEQVNK